MSIKEESLKELFKLSKKIARKGYYRLSSENFYNYLAYNRWQFINGTVNGVLQTKVEFG